MRYPIKYAQKHCACNAILSVSNVLLKFTTPLPFSVSLVIYEPHARWLACSLLSHGYNYISYNCETPLITASNAKLIISYNYISYNSISYNYISYKYISYSYISYNCIIYKYISYNCISYNYIRYQL